ncbi:ABC transporter ATP-binding protein [Dactylosporangium sp. CA-152071]|uniref:ABC transporter ATP-binding protein n=1 Tax=Dactylosporangium sp. CA-152071 TaxID=3239933 RepID=UPI003D94856B
MDIVALKNGKTGLCISDIGPVPTGPTFGMLECVLARTWQQWKAWGSNWGDVMLESYHTTRDVPGRQLCIDGGNRVYPEFMQRQQQLPPLELHHERLDGPACRQIDVGVPGSAGHTDRPVDEFRRIQRTRNREWSVAKIRLDEVSKVYTDGTRAVDGLSLEIADGELLALVGPSGCGKTTALRMVAGLEDISEGVVSIGGRAVNRVPARDRDIAMVFQSYALYPHLDVYNNIAFGLNLRKVPGAEIERRVTATGGVLGLKDHLRRRPRALSGGQRQRAAMGRAIVREPRAFLMDEPLSNLDANLRVQMRADIARTTRRLGVTTIYVTHDQTEAMTLGHRVAVMKKGVLQQVAAPQEIYDRPANMFVAGFIGSPAMNLVTGVFTASAEDVTLRIADQHLRVDPALLRSRPGVRAYFDRPVAVGIRPEDMQDVCMVPAGGAALYAAVDLVEALGSELLVHLRIGACGVTTDDTRELARDAGLDPVDPTGSGGWVRPLTELIARFSPRSRVRRDEVAEVAVDTARLHVFDLDTGRSIR